MSKASATRVARKRIAVALASGATELDLRIPDLAKIPAEIATLTALQTLRLNDTQVADLAPLRSLTALQTLSLDSTKVADLAPLRSLTALQTLYLDNTQVADLSPLRSLTEIGRAHV